MYSYKKKIDQILFDLFQTLHTDCISYYFFMHIFCSSNVSTGILSLLVRIIVVTTHDDAMALTPPPGKTGNIIQYHFLLTSYSCSDY